MSFLLLLARSKFARYLIGWIFAHMSFLIPVDRLYDTDTLMAFHHPKPSYAVHILLVPKQAVASLTTFDPTKNPFLAEIFSVAQKLILELDLAKIGYRLLVNGGEYQDVPQLHFHLIAGDEISRKV